VTTPSSTLLVTGGAGFIGSNFVHAAVRHGHRVVNLDKLTYAGNLDNLDSLAGSAAYTFVQGDIGDRALADRLLADHAPSAIVNFAAESHVDRSIDSPGDFIQTNIVGTWTLLEAARAYRGAHAERGLTFLHVSTDEVYGSLGDKGFFDESSPYAPNSPYAASKASSDHLVRAYHHTFKVPTITTNCSNNYGPYQFPEKLIPVVTLNALEGKPLPIYGDGSNIRDWLFVEDHCEGILAALARGKPGSTYCLGGRNESTNLELVKRICTILDELSPRADAKSYAEQITFVKDRPGHDQRYAIDPSLAEKELGWSPRHRFEDGLRKTLSWYLEHRDWCDRIAQGSYRRERLGLA
jgi:dTDP-glucose 4,6-dehydratase